MKTLLAMLLIALPASQAMTLTADLSIPALAQSVNISLDNTALQLYAGQIPVRFDDGSTALLYCIDPLVQLKFGAVTVNQAAPWTFPNGYRAAWILANYADIVSHAWEAASIQIAIWDLVLDGGDGFTAGRLQSTGNTDAQVLSQANSILTASSGKLASGATVYIPAMGSSYSQTLIGLSVAAVIATPEPTTYVLISAGLIFLAAIRRARPA